MVKVISLSDEAYRKLKSLKRGKNFSEAVIKLTVRKNKKKEVMRFTGAFKEDADKWERIKKIIYEDRKKFKLQEAKF